MAMLSFNVELHKIKKKKRKRQKSIASNKVADKATKNQQQTATSSIINTTWKDSFIENKKLKSTSNKHAA